MTEARYWVRAAVEQARGALSAEPMVGDGCSEIEIQEICSRLDTDALPDALDEFFRTAGRGESSLMQRWFPSARVGYPVVLEGRRRLAETSRIAGAALGPLEDVIVFFVDVSGTVAWVRSDDGHDPPVMYLSEDLSRASVWARTFSEWLRFVQPGEDFDWVSDDC